MPLSSLKTIFPALVMLLAAAIPGIARGNTLNPEAGQLAGLTEAARKNGEVRIIVSLRAPGKSGVRSEKISDKRLKSSVSITQDQFLTRIFGSAKEAPRTGNSRVLKKMAYAPMIAMTVSAIELKRIARDRSVVSVIADLPVRPSLSNSVPLIGMPAVYNDGLTGSDSIIAVLDTGVQTSHPFIAGPNRIVDEACFSSNVSGMSTSLCANGQPSQFGAGAGANCPYFRDGCYHGTHVAGIALGAASTVIEGLPANGVAKGAALFPVQVFSYFPNQPVGSRVLSWSSDQILGLERVYARRNDFGSRKIRAINMSLGGGYFTGSCNSQPQAPIIRLLREAGILTVIAAGNNGYGDAMNAPACITDAVTVAASDQSDKPAYFTNINASTTFFAPGVRIISSVPGNNAFTSLSGTSMATPHVAGALAVLMGAFPNKTPDEILNALKSTGVPVTDGAITKPRIQVDMAYRLLAADIQLSQQVVSVSRSPADIVAGPTRFTITVGSTKELAPLGWQLTGLPSWLSASTTTGQAGQSVEFTVLEPAIPTSLLTANLTFTEKGSIGPARSLAIEVRTTAPRLQLAGPAPEEIIRSGNDIFSVTSFDVVIASRTAGYSSRWTLSGLPDWLSASSVQGATGDRVTFRIVTPGYQNADLAAEIRIANTNLPGDTVLIPIVLKFVPDDRTTERQGNGGNTGDFNDEISGNGS